MFKLLKLPTSKRCVEPLKLNNVGNLKGIDADAFGIIELTRNNHTKETIYAKFNFTTGSGRTGDL